jgi:hypothetical protein
MVQATPLTTLQIAGKDTLWAAGLNFVTSSDGGYNWNYYGNNGGANFISTIDGLKGWVYFSNIFTDTRKILFTKDAGRTWVDELILKDGFVYAMFNIDVNLWIVGNDGLILKKRHEYTSVANEEPIVSQIIRLYQNYPNPFNSSTMISYELVEEVDIEFGIFDIIGKRIIRSV